MEKIPVIVLAAGKGTRLWPLTATTPKPLIKTIGKSILEHNLDAVLPYISEIVLIVGHLQEKFNEQIGTSYHGVPVSYVLQKDQIGTGHALYLARDKVKTANFLWMYGDDYYGGQIFQDIMQEGNATPTRELEDWQNYGVFKIRDQQLVDAIVEKPKKYIGKMVSIGVFILQKEIFSYFERIKKTVREEFEVTDMISLYAKDFDIKIIKTEGKWFPIGYPWQLLDLTEYLCGSLKTDIQGEVEKGAVIKGKVYLGKNSLIKSGAYLEGNFYIGENCVIGPNCHLRNFASIGDNCLVGNAVDLKSSVIGDGTKISHLAYVGDSVIGNNVNLAAGTITANLKHNQSSVKMRIKEQLVDTGRRKLGTVIGDNAKTGINTSIYPGRKIGQGVWTIPGEVVAEDKLKS
ncbi:hypothetical protein A3F03_03395 [Candidatus Roizmanbacteria bacterium RIFCSPHIGHO2_12_FULL_41_11]|uniref:Uncharacterized protein n=3 Tax=Candidatus Roizmaniibacteriota TaxID=1752723 RepID=A0A1F7JR33_9BACT|nr:MAG: hypothetical protein A3F03_03395 [Candidatus Roizmanbacteria bacterium RIFCSPHIGHO2_12_FULL_41_11]OGK51620.1 MAG: hypothetical protein A2966_01075 [Candidatus Roizmanbacteria bacterium RIFCSPLOWO2_01_FULL_41_22]OGK58059.1 MAG: hypothetical protein A3H86_00605 [Candidatus Roizmanbacteria bacterium RIFCSPLOWO2_02_FULL_41_9]